MSKDGGKVSPKDVRDYQAPQGPTEQMRSQVGLGGENYGCCPEMESSVKSSESGSPGIGGTNHGCRGTQGKH